MRRKTVELLRMMLRMLAGRRRRTSRWSPQEVLQLPSRTSSQDGYSTSFTPTSVRASNGSGFCTAGEPEGSSGMTWALARPCRFLHSWLDCFIFV
uniref:Uncharacterized protein n=1 Tax=Arundo donax TaxID=35708 RepID=A0A0A9CYV8_ARUDO